MKEREAIENEIRRIELIAEFEFGIPHLSKMQKKSGRLPVHVRCILDEFANISPIPDFQNLIATMRSREISATIILQTLSQIKEMYKDSWETITGNCDTYVFLGGQEQSTLEYTSKKMGKATIDKRSTGHNKGRQGSFSQNWDTLGRELMHPDEIAKMDNEDCLLFIRGKNPIYDKKYSLDKHPRYEMIDEDGSKEYNFKAKFNTKLVSEELLKEKNMLGKELHSLMEKKFNQILEKLSFQLEPVSEEDLKLLPEIPEETMSKSALFIETYKNIVKNILSQEDILEDMQYNEVMDLIYKAAERESIME